VNPLRYLSEHAKAIVAALLAAVAPFVAAQAANTGIDSSTWTLAVLAAIAALVGVGGIPNADKSKPADSPPTQVQQLVTAAQLLTTAGQQIAAHKPVTVPMLTPGQADTINRLEQAYSAYSAANPAMKLPPVLPTVEGTAPSPTPRDAPVPVIYSTATVPATVAEPALATLGPAPADPPLVSFVDPIARPVDHSTGPVPPVSEPVGATAVSATP